MPDAALTVERLAPRRACLEGAKQTLESVAATIANADSLKAARLSLEVPVAERLELLDLALRQFDAALAGEDPPDA